MESRGIYPLNREAVFITINLARVYKFANSNGIPSGVQDTLEMGITNAQEEGETKIHSHPNKEIGIDFEALLHIDIEYLFITIDKMNPSFDEDIAILDTEVEELNSMIHFLQLLIVSIRISNYKRDLLVDFAKSIILTSSLYKDLKQLLRCLMLERTQKGKIEAKRRA